MSEFAAFKLLLDGLIAFNQDRRAAETLVSREIRNQYAPNQFAENFCTVACDAGRQTGKTEYIKQSADTNSLVIVPSMKHGRAWFGNKPCFTVCTEKMLHRIAAERTFSTIYVDEPRYALSDRSMMYQLLARRDADQTFILLGAQ
jgi:hypothetical protein